MPKLVALLSGLSLLMGLSLQATLPSLIPMRIGGQFGYCDPDLKIVIPPRYDDASPFGHIGAVVGIQRHKGFIDGTGRWILPPEYDDITQLPLALRIERNNHYALADLQGCLLSDFDYHAIIPLRDGHYATTRADRKGILGADGRIIVPNDFDHVSQLRDDQGNYVELYAVRLDGYVGLYNTCGERMHKPRFERVDTYHEGFAVVQGNSGQGLLDVEGILRVPCQYDQILPMSEGLCPARLKNRWGFIDGNGREVVPFLFEAVQETGFTQGRAAVLRAGVWIFVRRDGEMEFPLDQGFQCLGAMSEGLAPVCRLMDGGDVRFGYVDPEGKLRIPFQFEKAESFKRGFAIVAGRTPKEQSLITETHYGIIDRTGRLVIPLQLRGQTMARLKRDSLGYLGFTSLDLDGRRCMIDGRGHKFDCQGNTLDDIQRTFLRTRCEQSDLVAVSKGDLWGFCDSKGRIVIPCQYAAVQCFDNGLARVWPTGASENIGYYIDETGKQYYQAE